MKNKLYLISTGPGNINLISIKAKNAIKECDIIIGYEKYIEDIKPLIKDKEIYYSSMTEEIKRANKAIELALENKKVALISNGDINVFGLAPLVVELINKQNLWDKIELITIPGVPSFLEAAAKIGAPLGQDFAVISLSDRLTPIETIEKRIELAINADFVIIILNPKSRTRSKPYEKLLNKLHKQSINHPVIIAENISRDNEKIEVLNTKELIKKGIDKKNVHMSSLLIIGNSTSTWTKNNKMLTPRGYLSKYKINGKLK